MCLFVDVCMCVCVRVSLACARVRANCVRVRFLQQRSPSMHGDVCVRMCLFLLCLFFVCGFVCVVCFLDPRECIRAYMHTYISVLSLFLFCCRTNVCVIDPCVCVCASMCIRLACMCMI
eukprot:GDKI01008820.1.p3 GENE.GDKI01008820.1~~GDKI01008820.1.p3  ORF type:complete len:119 (+),score=28.00 GDKI01008820.1:55-411(+)